MQYSEFFPKAKREVKAESVNQRLLVKAGFMDQLMAGSWTLLPLGFRVVTKINQIIREEMNRIGGQEMLMPLLHPKELWKETGRWEKADEIMYKLKDSRQKEYGLSFTHEEVVMDLLKKNITSYQDLPVYVYHFSTKFRNEPRARAGILRGREFMMKDLYSAHKTEAELMKYYDKVKTAYQRIFDRLKLKTVVTEADGGVFTDKNTHEFQVLSEGGEDTIYYCPKCKSGFNQEIFKGKTGDQCLNCKKGKIVKGKSIEVGNIFPLGKWYAEKMKVYYTDKNGEQKLVWFGSYGIGPTRVMGTYAEVYADQKGLVWPKIVTPFEIYLVSLKGGEKQALKIYQSLKKAGWDVLWDDRQISAGVKLMDADLIGIPVRLVVSQKTGQKAEWKERTGQKTELLSLEDLEKRLKEYYG